MRKVIYESFVRCHILYGITVWGGAKNSILKPLENQLSKIWSKLVHKRMHTLNILQNTKVFKLKDELKLQELKYVWKWVNKKLPISLNQLLIEKVNNLRHRRFHIGRTWKDGSISHRLAKRANLAINQIANARTKSTLVNRSKKEITSSYAFICRQRNCFICGNRNG